MFGFYLTHDMPHGPPKTEQQVGSQLSSVLPASLPATLCRLRASELSNEPFDSCPIL